MIMMCYYDPFGAIFKLIMMLYIYLDGKSMRTQFVIEGQTKLAVPELERFRTQAGDYAPNLRFL